MVRRVRKHLRFQAQRIALTIDATAFADDRAIEKISGIELNGRRGGEHFQNAAGYGVFQPRRHSQAVRTRLTREHEVVMVATSDAQLLVESIANGLADD